MKFWRRKKCSDNMDLPRDSAVVEGAVSAPRLHSMDQPLSRCNEDLTLFRSTHSISTKVWLPEPLDDHLKELAEHLGANRSELIRNALFQHAYGWYRYEQMRNQREGLFWEPPLSDVARFSRTVAAPYDLGKNNVNVRVWLPAKLRDDLASLAGRDGKTWSHYVREVLILHFMGHRLLVETESALTAACRQPVDESAAGDGSA